jgi:methylglyoxal synthase
MTREQIRANIIDSTIDAILTAYWGDTIEVEALEQDLDDLLRSHLVYARPITTKSAEIVPQTEKLALTP